MLKFPYIQEWVRVDIVIRQFFFCLVATYLISTGLKGHKMEKQFFVQHSTEIEVGDEKTFFHCCNYRYIVDFRASLIYLAGLQFLDTPVIIYLDGDRL